MKGQIGWPQKCAEIPGSVHQPRRADVPMRREPAVGDWHSDERIEHSHGPNPPFKSHATGPAAMTAFTRRRVGSCTSDIARMNATAAIAGPTKSITINGGGS